MAKHRHLRRRRHRAAGALLLLDRLRARGRRPSPSTPRYRRADTFLDLPLVAFDEVAGAYPPATHQHVRRAELRADEPAARREVPAGQGAGLQLASYVSSRCTYLTQHPPATTASSSRTTPSSRSSDRQQRDALERQPHRPRLDDRGPLLHQLARRRLRPRHDRAPLLPRRQRDDAERITIGAHTLIGAGAVIMKNTRTAIGLRRRSAPSGSPRPATRGAVTRAAGSSMDDFAPGGQAALDWHARGPAVVASRLADRALSTSARATRDGTAPTSATSTSGSTSGGRVRWSSAERRAVAGRRSAPSTTRGSRARAWSSDGAAVICITRAGALGVSVPFYLAAGLAISDDGGHTFAACPRRRSSIAPPSIRFSPPRPGSSSRTTTGGCGTSRAPDGASQP